MSGPAELHSKVNDYLERRIGLRDLESWLVPRLPIYLDAPGSAVARLVGVIELSLAELHAGLRAERSLRAVVSRYLSMQRTVWFEYPADNPQNITSSSETESLTAPAVLNLLPSWNIEFAGATG